MAKSSGPSDVGGGGGKRGLKVKLKSAKGRRISSTRWLERQLNDPYVAAARRDGYRARAAYKLLELDDKYHFLKKGIRVVDLGAAPGGWCQVAVARTKASMGKGKVIGIDIQEMEPIAGATLRQLDFMEPGADDVVKEMLGGEADVVLSDMAASASGHRQTDHLKIMALAEAGAYFAHDVLTSGGTYCAKVLQGGAEADLLKLLKKDFKVVRHVKPEASRSDSAEMYVLATGFRGRDEDEADE